MKMMKQMACAALVAAIAVGIAGCGDKASSTGSSGDGESSLQPKVAEGAIAAFVVRPMEDTSLAPLCKQYGLGLTDLMKRAPGDFQEFIKELELDKAEIKWVAWNIDPLSADKIEKGNVEFAAAIATSFDIDKFVAFAEKKFKERGHKDEVKKTTIADVPAYIVIKSEKPKAYLANLDKQFILVATTSAGLEKQIALYRDGKGASADFGSFTLDANDVIRLKVAKVGENVKKALPSPDALQMVNGFVPDGDKVILGLASVEINLRASSDGKSATFDVSVETASDADADKLTTAAKSGLMMATAAVKQKAEKDAEAKAALDVLESAKIANEGKVAKLSVTFPAELPIKSFVKYKSGSKSAACISNMKQIQTACEMYRMSNADKVPTLDDICGPEKYIKTEPRCPLGGRYKISMENNGNVGVSCSHAAEGHVLPD